MAKPSHVLMLKIRNIRWINQSVGGIQPVFKRIARDVAGGGGGRRLWRSARGRRRKDMAVTDHLTRSVTVAFPALLVARVYRAARAMEGGSGVVCASA